LSTDIDDRLAEANKKLADIRTELEWMLRKKPLNKASRNDLLILGFTKEEADAWLDQEPNYSRRIFKLSDGNLHDDKSDDNFTEPYLLSSLI